MREKLTVVLFKDHLTSRTLRLPLHWLPRLGILWLIAMLLTLLAAGLFFRAFFRSADGTGAFAVMKAQDKAEELEKQLAELKTSYDALQARTQTNTSSTQVAAVTPGGSNFTAIPVTATKDPLPPRESLPFRLEALKAQWKGNSLQLTTAIEYIKDDGGNQQGHFVILARGPQDLFAYPDGVLNASGGDTLIRPDGGEYFSVSRYREVKASFGPVQNRDSIRSIEVFVFGPKKELIYFDRVGVEAPKPKAAAPAPTAAAPQAAPEGPASTAETPAAQPPANPTGAEGASP